MLVLAFFELIVNDFLDLAGLLIEIDDLAPYATLTSSSFLAERLERSI
jgi:hypothetical protein